MIYKTLSKNLFTLRNFDVLERTLKVIFLDKLKSIPEYKNNCFRFHLNVIIINNF